MLLLKLSLKYPKRTEKHTPEKNKEIFASGKDKKFLNSGENIFCSRIIWIMS
jgi:hypothetical protein